MAAELDDVTAFVAVALAGGFRDAARARGVSASSLSEAVRRLEAKLGVRLLNRTTRSVAPTEAGARLFERLGPALRDIDSALAMVDSFRDRPAGTLRLNVPGVAARLVLPRIVPRFLAAYPEIRLEVTAEDRRVDILAAGFDAGIRYEEHLEKDMVAVPIGPRVQRFATAASPAYVRRHGRPTHPRQLVEHACLRGRFEGRPMAAWEFERDGEIVTVNPSGPLVVSIASAVDLVIAAALAGTGIIYLFEDWLRPYLAQRALQPLLKPWWQRFSGPFLYYPSRRHLPAALRAFVDFIRA